MRCSEKVCPHRDIIHDCQALKEPNGGQHSEEERMTSSWSWFIRLYLSRTNLSIFSFSASLIHSHIMLPRITSLSAEVWCQRTAKVKCLHRDHNQYEPPCFILLFGIFPLTAYAEHPILLFIRRKVLSLMLEMDFFFLRKELKLTGYRLNYYCEIR